MTRELEYIGSLLGRVFLISQPKDLINWNGCDENDIVSDFDSLKDFISFTEGNVTIFKKNLESIFFIYFSMSSKVEIFKKSNGFIICDGLYFNEILENPETTKFEIVEELPLKIEIFEKKIIIFDATIQGSVINTDSERINDIHGNNFNSYSVITMKNGIYNVNRVCATISHTDNIFIKGVDFSVPSVSKFG